MYECLLWSSIKLSANKLIVRKNKLREAHTMRLVAQPMFAFHSWWPYPTENLVLNNVKHSMWPDMDMLNASKGVLWTGNLFATCHLPWGEAWRLQAFDGKPSPHLTRKNYLRKLLVASHYAQKAGRARSWKLICKVHRCSPSPKQAFQLFHTAQHKSEKSKPDEMSDKAVWQFPSC